MSSKMQYLMVLGTQRTGKTLLGRALNMHPQMVVQKEPYFFFFKLCRNIFYRDILKRDNFDSESPMDTLFCRSNEEKRLLYRSFPDLRFTRTDIDELVRLTIQQQEVQKGERAVNVVKHLNGLKPGSSVSVFVTLMDILYRSYAKEGAIVVGFSEAWCDEFITPLLAINDLDIKVIHCHRDPRAVVASRNSGSKLYAGMYPLLFIIRHWRKAVAYTILHRSDRRFMAIRYEDLIGDPKRCMSSVCDFMGVPFDAALLNVSGYVKGDGTPWKPNSAFELPASQGFSTSSLERWKGILSEDVLAVVEYLCDPEMKYLGYARSVPDPAPDWLLSFREDEAAIVPWLHKYKLACNESEMALEVVRRYFINGGSAANAEWLSDYFVIDMAVAKGLAAARWR